MVANCRLGAVPFWRWVPGGEDFQANDWRVTAHDRIAEPALALVPRHALSSARRTSSARTSPTAARVLSLPKLGDATWVAADETRSSYADRFAPLPAAAALVRLRRAPDWQLVFERDGVLVFHKRKRVERDEDEVPGEQRPDLRADRPELVVVEVPALRERERGDEQGARGDAAERHERDRARRGTAARAPS